LSYTRVAPPMPSSLALGKSASRGLARPAAAQKERVRNFPFDRAEPAH